MSLSTVVVAAAVVDAAVAVGYDSFDGTEELPGMQAAAIGVQVAAGWRRTARARTLVAPS